MSGGNAQKVVLAKWLETNPAVLLLHEPTQGVDIAARSQIYRTITAAADAGTSVVWVTNDFDELAATCDRIVVVGDGAETSQLVGERDHPRSDHRRRVRRHRHPRDQAGDMTATSIPSTRQVSLITRYGERLALPFAWLALIVLFSIKAPDRFPTSNNLGSVLGTQSALFILALAALLPAMAGDLDLSLGFVGALGAMSMAVLNAQHGWPIVPAALAAVGIGAVCGFLNGFLVVKLKTEPFIMTLGTGAVFNGFLLWIADSNTITGVSSSLADWTYGNRLWVIPIQFVYALGRCC